MLAINHKAVETNSLVVPRSFSNSLVVLNAIAARLSNIAFSQKPIGQPDFALLVHIRMFCRARTKI